MIEGWRTSIYNTYEELKQNIMDSQEGGEQMIYNTYEELKQFEV